MQSFYADVAAQPTQNMLANVSFNMLGDVPSNPIDELFYENRGRPRNVRVDGEDFALQDIERLKVYNAGVSWDDRWFHLEGFYRTGHYHWGYEGDFFGLYQEANYGPNIDIYNGQAPVGMEIAGKRFLGGLKVAVGPELWWGANPAVLVKHQSRIGPLETAVMYQEDLAEAGTATSSFAIPLPPTRKATVHVAATRDGATFEAGGIMSGSTKVGETFQVVDGEPGSYRVLQDEIRTSDAFGAKAKISYTRGRLNWYLQGAAMGLVADGGFTQTQTFTGWTLKDTGSGNQRNVITGFTVLAGHWQIAPNFLWRKPLVGPVPGRRARAGASPQRPRRPLRGARQPGDPRGRDPLHLRSDAGHLDVQLGQRPPGGRGLRGLARLRVLQLPDHAGRRDRDLRRRTLHLRLPRRPSPTRSVGSQGADRVEAVGRAPA